VIEKIGPVSYMVQLPDGRIIRRHQDHLRICRNDDQDVSEQAPAVEQSDFSELPVVEDMPLDIPVGSQNIPSQPISGTDVNMPATDVEVPTVNPETPETRETIPQEDSPTGEVATPSQSTPPRKVYPRRERKPPVWFDGRKT